MTLGGFQLVADAEILRLPDARRSVDVRTLVDSRPSIQEKTAAGLEPESGNRWLIWALILFMVYLIILAVGMVGSGFKWASGGEEGARKLFEFATNPFMGLLMGTLATAMVQSSSTVTSVIVGLCAGGLPVSTAVPMVMGANIGTTVTNTLVSLGHVRDKKEFRRAFQAATIHDFFNLMAVIIFLPLEYFFGFLQKLSDWIAKMFAGGDSMSMSGFNFIKAVTKPVVSFTQGMFEGFPEPFGGVALAILGVILIFIAIFNIGKLLRRVMTGKARELFHAAVGRGPVTGIFSGTVITVLVQSSSTTTSLAVPLAGTGVLSLREIYPFTLGANIGTTITALLASTAATGELAIFALEIALVHLLYNLLGVFVIYGIPILRNIPLYLAESLASLASTKKLLAIGYIAAVFFFVPLVFLGVYELFG